MTNTEGRMIDTVRKSLQSGDSFVDAGRFKICPELEKYMESAGNLSDDQMREMFKRGDHPQYQLAVWKEKGLLVDGHRRHRISSEFGVKLPIHEISFRDEIEVLLWMVNKQDSGRNLTELARAQAIDRRLCLAQMQKGSDGQSSGDKLEAAAKEIGISRKTAYKHRRLARAYDSLAPELQEAVRDGSVKIGASYIPLLSQLDSEHQLAILGKLYEDRDYLKKRFANHSAARRKVQQGVAEAKEKADNKIAEGAVQIPLPEGVEVKTKPVVDEPKQKGKTVSNHRVREFIRDVNHLHGKFHKECDRILDECLSDGAVVSEWKRRIDYHQRMIGKIFNEILEAHDRK